MWKRIKRALKHSWSADSINVVLPQAALERLGRQVQDSERLHLGEIRIYVEARLPNACVWRDQPLSSIIRDRAVEVFSQLRVWDTADNTGVLVYLLLAERRIELVADRGINAHVSAATWAVLVTQMQAAFKDGAYEQGLAEAIEVISRLLVMHFPCQRGLVNRNELPDVPVLRR